MKRVLVIDESAVVRETLALILGSEFLVLKRPLETGVHALVRADENIDLLIYGVASPVAVDVSSLLRFAAQAACAVLFLMESKTTARAIEDRGEFACLAKPFNPYELLDKVKELLARREIFPNGPTAFRPLSEAEKAGRFTDSSNILTLAGPRPVWFIDLRRAACRC